MLVAEVVNDVHNPVRQMIVPLGAACIFACAIGAGGGGVGVDVRVGVGVEDGDVVPTPAPHADAVINRRTTQPPLNFDIVLLVTGRATLCRKHNASAEDEICSDSRSRGEEWLDSQAFVRQLVLVSQMGSSLHR